MTARTRGGPALPRGAHTVRALVGYGLFAAVRAAGLVAVADALAAGLALLALGGARAHPGAVGPLGDPVHAPLVGSSWAVPSGLVEQITERGLRAEDFTAVLAFGLVGAACQALAAWGAAVTARRAALDTKQRVRASVLARVLRTGGQDAPEGSGPTGVLVTRGLDDLDPYYTQTLTSLVSVAVIPLLVGLRILGADLLSAVVVVLTVPLVPVFMVLIGVHTREATDEARSAQARFSHHLVELARGLPVLVGLGRAHRIHERIDELSRGERDATMATLRIAFLSALALELIASLSVAVVAVLVGVRLLSGSLTLDAGLIALILAPECYQPLRALGAAFHASEDGLAAVRRVNRVLDTPLPSGLHDDAAARLPASGHPPAADGLRVRGLSVRFAGRSMPAVADLGFDAAPGQITALTGASGAGKTTVLRVLAGLLPDGVVLTGSTDPVRVTGELGGWDPERVVWVPQEPTTVGLTVAEELALHGDGGTDLKAAAAMCTAEHLLERDPAELSLGELRRVAVARAFVRLAALARSGGLITVLLDEPTAHLDLETAHEIRAAVARMRERFPEAVILVAGHDPALMALADHRVAVEPTGAEADAVGHATGAEPRPAAPTARAAEASAAAVASTAAGAVGVSGERATSSAEAAVEHERQTWGAALRAVGRVLPWWRPRWLAAMALGTLSTGFGIALTVLSGWLIVAAAGRPPILTLLVAIVGVRFFGLGRAVIRYVERLTTHRAVLDAAGRWRSALWDALAVRAVVSGRARRAESTVERIIADVDELRDLSPRVLLPITVGVLVNAAAVLTVLVLLPDAWGLQLAVTFVALVLAPACTVLADRSATAAEGRIRAAVGRRVIAVLDAAAQLRVHRADGPVLDRLWERDTRVTRAARRAAWAQGLGEAIVTAAGIGAAVGCVLIGVPRVLDGAVGAPAVAAVVLLQTALIAPGLEVSAAARHLGRFTELARRVGEQTERDGAPRGAGDAASSSRVVSPGAVDVRLRDVAVRWPGAAQPVFRGVNARVETGRWLGVLGPSGAGKSTLLAALLGFVAPVEGEIVWRGPGAEAAPRCAWCPQDAHLFDSTVRSNLGLAREQPISDEEMLEVLARVGLGPWLAHLPDGLETRVGAGGREVSGGQRQRLAVARALLTRAPVLLLDEPTAHLDAPTAAAMLADIRTSTGDRAVVLVTHREQDVGPADEVLRWG